MTNKPEPEGAPIRDCTDCGQEIHAPATTAGKPTSPDWTQTPYATAGKVRRDPRRCPTCGTLCATPVAAPAEPSDSAAVREALQAELDWLSAEWPPVPRSGVVDDWVVWAFRLDQYHRGHMADLRRKIAALASTPAQPYSPKGNFCSICQVHDRWCEHIQSPAAPAQRDAGEKVRLARRIETAIANRNDGETVFDAIKAALLAEGSKP